MRFLDRWLALAERLSRHAVWYAGGLMLARGVGFVEAIEDERQVFGRDARAGVADRELHAPEPAALASGAKPVDADVAATGIAARGLCRE